MIWHPTMLHQGLNLRQKMRRRAKKHINAESFQERGVNRQVKTFSTKTRSKLGKTELISKFTQLTLEMRCSK
jgi:hypothetical protein